MLQKTTTGNIQVKILSFMRRSLPMGHRPIDDRHTDRQTDFVRWDGGLLCGSERRFVMPIVRPSCPRQSAYPGLTITYQATTGRAAITFHFRSILFWARCVQLRNHMSLLFGKEPEPLLFYYNHILLIRFHIFTHTHTIRRSYYSNCRVIIRQNIGDAFHRSRQLRKINQINWYSHPNKEPHSGYKEKKRT